MNSIVSIDPSAIHTRAYARWQERGCPDGSSEHDWFEAERDLEREQQRSAVSRAASAAELATPVALSAPAPVTSVKKEQKQARSARRAAKRTGTTAVTPASATLPGNVASTAAAKVTGKRRAASG